MDFKARQSILAQQLNRITKDEPLTFCPTCIKRIVGGSFNQLEMATINYTTLQLPKILWDYSEMVQETPHFDVRRYKHKKGIIFRVPKGAKPGQTFHAFMEHLQ